MMAKITLLDGGMGQELIARSGRAPTSLWATQVMLDQPELVRDIHADQFRQGRRLPRPTPTPSTTTAWSSKGWTICLATFMPPPLRWPPRRAMRMGQADCRALRPRRARHTAPMWPNRLIRPPRNMRKS